MRELRNRMFRFTSAEKALSFAERMICCGRYNPTDMDFACKEGEWLVGVVYWVL